MSDITIAEVTNANWRDALQLSVPPEQLPFVAGMQPIAALGLAKAYVRPWGLVWTPYVFSVGETLIGFAELAYEPDSAANYHLLHFFIDGRFQGQGYGAAALRVFLQHVKAQHPNCQIMQLTVHPDNVRAQRLYTRAGFRPTGTELGGEPLYQRDMRE